MNDYLKRKIRKSIDSAQDLEPMTGMWLAALAGVVNKWNYHRSFVRSISKYEAVGKSEVYKYDFNFDGWNRSKTYRRQRTFQGWLNGSIPKANTIGPNNLQERLFELEEDLAFWNRESAMSSIPVARYILQAKRDILKQIKTVGLFLRRLQ